MTIFSPPFMADSWAQSPTMVQLAEVAASGRAGRSPLTALKKAWTRCGCEPPWPPPWRNERCSASWMADGWREPADRLGQQLGVVGHLDPLGDLGLGQRMLRRALGVDDRIFVLDLLPLEALLAAVGVEALAVLPGDVEQAAGHLGDDVRVLDRERGRLDGERAAVLGDQLLADPARAVADDAARHACPGSPGRG